MTIFGLDLGLLLGGAVLTESDFSLPRPRQVRRRRASTNNDLPRSSASPCSAAFFIILANLIVDLLYAVIDPRVRL